MIVSIGSSSAYSSLSLDKVYTEVSGTKTVLAHESKRTTVPTDFLEAPEVNMYLPRFPPFWHRYTANRRTWRSLVAKEQQRNHPETSAGAWLRNKVIGCFSSLFSQRRPKQRWSEHKMPTLTAVSKNNEPAQHGHNHHHMFSIRSWAELLVVSVCNRYEVAETQHRAQTWAGGRWDPAA